MHPHPYLKSLCARSFGCKGNLHLSVFESWLSLFFCFFFSFSFSGDTGAFVIQVAGIVTRGATAWEGLRPEISSLIATTTKSNEGMLLLQLLIRVKSLRCMAQRYKNRDRAPQDKRHRGYCKVVLPAGRKCLDGIFVFSRMIVVCEMWEIINLAQKKPKNLNYPGI